MLLGTDAEIKPSDGREADLEAETIGRRFGEALGPAHRDMENGVEPAEIGIARHLKLPPHGRFRAFRADQDDFQLIDRSDSCKHWR